MTYCTMSQQCEGRKKKSDLELQCPEKGDESPLYLVLFVPGEIRKNSKLL